MQKPKTSSTESKDSGRIWREKIDFQKMPFGGIRFRKILTRDIFAKKFYLRSLGRGWVAEQHFMEALRLRENTLRWLSFLT